MMQSIKFIDEKLFYSVILLASGLGSLQERLASAYIDQLRLIQPNKLLTVISEELKKELEEKLSKITEELIDDGQIETTLKVMSDEKAREIAEEIV